MYHFSATTICFKCFHNILNARAWGFAYVSLDRGVAGRRRPPCAVDGRRPRPETPSEDTAELCKMEEDINSSGFAPVSSGGWLHAASNYLRVQWVGPIYVT